MAGDSPSAMSKRRCSIRPIARGAIVEIAQVRSVKISSVPQSARLLRYGRTIATVFWAKGLLVYTGSGINRMPNPFTGPYAASKAAGDVLAEVMALETARYGIETVIVQPGAYTSGTDHFKHAV